MKEENKMVKRFKKKMYILGYWSRGNNGVFSLISVFLILF